LGQVAPTGDRRNFHPVKEQRVILKTKRVAAAALLLLMTSAAGFAEPDNELSAFRVFSDKEKGVSFRYPVAAKVKTGREDVSVILLGDPGNAVAPTAVIALGFITPEDDDVNAMDEQGFIAYTATMNETMSQISGPETVTVAGKKWQRAEFRMAEGVIRMVVLKEKKGFFGIVFFARPAAAAEEYADEFDALLGSLKLDPAQWAASLQKK
jgi:hypothetical protein